MKHKILIAGSGKTALDIGSFFLEKGHEVCWVTGSETQKTKVDRHLGRLERRQNILSGPKERSFSGSCCLVTDCPGSVDIIIESSHENLQKKKELFAALKSSTTKQTLLFSNSSSFLPETIAQNCFGAHFLYPLLLTNLVELVVPPVYQDEQYQKSLQLFQENDLDFIEQENNNCFLINRLLLPLQAECFKALRLGIPADLVDEASKCNIFPIGQLSLMDRIGLDIIYAAAVQYTHYLDSHDLDDHHLMIESLKTLVGAGKNGKKNQNGLLQGTPLPWQEDSEATFSTAALRSGLVAKFEERCQRALDNGEISPKKLSLVFARAYQANNCDIDLLQNRVRKDYSRTI